MPRFLHGLVWRLWLNTWYLFHPPWDTGISPPELFEFINSHPPGRALDLGCGSGTNVVTLAQHGWQTVGLDYTWRALALARRKIRQSGVRADVYLADVSKPDFGLAGKLLTFDLVLDIGCFHNLSPAGRQVYLLNLSHYLVPGGYYLLYTHYRDDIARAGLGLGEDEITEISQYLAFIQRRDGMERGIKRSGWLMYQKQDGE